MLELFAGVFGGLIIASVGWGVGLKVLKKKAEKERAASEELMHSIGEHLVEADSLISSFRSGIMDKRSFSKAITQKADAINRILKPNFHCFDVYFVKYVELLVGNYRRKASLEQAPEDTPYSDGLNFEMETSISSAPPPEQTDLFKSPNEEPRDDDTIVIQSGEKSKTPVRDNKEQSALSEEEEFSTETLIDADRGLVASYLQEATDISESDLEKTRLFDPEMGKNAEKRMEKRTAAERLPAAEESIDTRVVKNNEVLDKKEKSIPEETTINRVDDKTRFFTPAQKGAANLVIEDFEVAIPEQFTESSQKATALFPSEPIVVPKETPLFDKTESALPDDMVTGEDIADKIASIAPLFTAKPKEEKPKEDKAKEQETSQVSSPETIPEKEMVPSGKDSSSKDKKRSSQKGGSDDSITGDDVADQIDSFFGLFKG